eukprot:13960648-Alexandrium_andersonii.AAC.1
MSLRFASRSFVAVCVSGFYRSFCQRCPPLILLAVSTAHSRFLPLILLAAATAQVCITRMRCPRTWPLNLGNTHSHSSRARAARKRLQPLPRRPVPVLNGVICCHSFQIERLGPQP